MCIPYSIISLQDAQRGSWCDPCLWYCCKLRPPSSKQPDTLEVWQSLFRVTDSMGERSYVHDFYLSSCLTSWESLNLRGTRRARESEKDTKKPLGESSYQVDKNMRRVYSRLSELGKNSRCPPQLERKRSSLKPEQNQHAAVHRGLDMSNSVL